MHLLDFQVLSLMNQTQWTLKDICFLKCINKGFKQNIQMNFVSSNSFIRAFYKWKKYTKMMINDKSTKGVRLGTRSLDRKRVLCYSFKLSN